MKNRLDSIVLGLKEHKEPILAPVIVFGLGIIIYNLPYHFISDYLRLSSYAKILDSLHLIVSALISLIGIYISASLLAFSFFKQKTGLDFNRLFRTSKLNSFFVSFTVSVIIFVFYSKSLIIESSITNNQVSLLYYNYFIFTIVILLLVVVSFSIFSSLKPEKVANDEISKITSDSISISFNTILDFDKDLKKQESDPFNKVERITIALITVGEIRKANYIILKTVERTSTLLFETNERRGNELINNRLISFLNNIIDVSLDDPKCLSILNSVWYSVFSMYEKLIPANESAIKLIKIRSVFIKSYFNKLIDNSKNEAFQSGLHYLEEIIINQILYNVLPENENSFFDVYRDPEDKIYSKVRKCERIKINQKHWEEVALNLTEVYISILEKAIANKNENFINITFGSLRKLPQNTFHGTEIFTQTFLLIKIYGIMFDYTYKAFYKNVFYDGYEVDSFYPALFDNLLENKHIAAKGLLRRYCKLVINLQKINKLDPSFIGGYYVGGYLFDEGIIGKIIREYIRKYDSDPIYKNYIDDCIETLKILKENYQESDPVRNIYYSLKRHVEHAKKELTKCNVSSDNIQERINELAASFEK